jgi:hypothetical protein
MVTEMLKFFPAGMSAKTLAHYGQVCASRRFMKPDLGTPEDNREAYGDERPPSYDLRRCAVPVALFAGDMDSFTNEQV